MNDPSLSLSQRVKNRLRAKLGPLSARRARVGLALGRQLPSLVLLAPLAALSALVASGLWRSGGLSGWDPTQGEAAPWLRPGLRIAQEIGACCPSFDFFVTLSGPALLGWVLTLISAWGLSVAAFRTSGNRIVAVAAGWIFASHPGLGVVTSTASYDDRLAALFFAWALAFQLGAAPGASRFPTRGSSSYRPLAFAVFLVSILFSSHAWWIGLGLVLVDLGFGLAHRESLRSRYWKGDLPYLGGAGGALIFSLLLRPVELGVPTGPAGPWFSVWAGPQAAPHSWLFGIAGGTLVFAVIAVFLADLVFRITKHRRVIREAVFAMGLLGVFSVASGLFRFETPLAQGPMAMIGIALFLPSLAWRLILPRIPEPDPAIARRPQTLDLIRGAISFQTLPELEFESLSEPAWDDASREHQSVASVPGSEPDAPRLKFADEGLYAEIVRPLYDQRGAAAEVASLAGRFREVSRLAVARDQLTILVAARDVPDRVSRLFEGFENTQFLAIGDEAHFPLPQDSLSALFFSDGLAAFRNPALAILAEAARVLQDEGICAGRVAEAEIQAGKAPSAPEAAALFGRAGLRVESLREGESGGYVFVARRKLR